MSHVWKRMKTCSFHCSYKLSDHFDSSVNFILLKTDIPLYKILLKDKILIRKNLSGLDDKFYRMAVRTHEENEYFINTIKKGLK